MKEASPKYSLKTSKDSRRRTSSPASADGASQLELLDGPTTNNCGPGLALVSLFPLPVKPLHNSTSAISGRTSSASSRRVDLSALLASRLQQRLASIGSTECSMTWKERATPAGRSFFQLQLSAPRTRETDFGLWPTPTARDYKDSGKNVNYEKLAKKSRLAGRVVFTHGGQFQRGHDGRHRRIAPGVPCLAHGVPARVERTVAFGNAIVPQVAAEFLAAALECRP